MADYNNLKGAMGAVARKAGGSLAVRDINTLVKPQQLVDSENMTTAFVVVSKFAIKDWETSYEKLCNFVVRGWSHGATHVPMCLPAWPWPCYPCGAWQWDVAPRDPSLTPRDCDPQVPRSSKVIAEDNDYTLVSVVLFKRVIDDFKTACRSKGFQVGMQGRLWSQCHHAAAACWECPAFQSTECNHTVARMRGHAPPTSMNANALRCMCATTRHPRPRAGRCRARRWSS